MTKTIRSPLFYVGDKYKLMSQLSSLFPKNINKHIEPFVGGGSSFLNSSANLFVVNDINIYVIRLHKCLYSYRNNPEIFLKKLFFYIKKYNLSCSYLNVNMPSETLKKDYPKTYYAKHNKENYNKLKNAFNKNKKNMVLLYLLIIYGFNHMIRFNSNNEYNIPVGNIDFNKNVYNALIDYFEFCKVNEIIYSNMDYKDFLSFTCIEDNDFIFFDPPYLISSSEYNRLWDEKKEQELLLFLDILNDRGVKWGITNLLFHKNQTNEIFKEWAKKYTIYNIESNYISFNDNTIKENSKEIYVTNYDKTKEKTKFN